MKNYLVTGMSCAACSARVEKAVRGVAGVTECSVNLLTGDMGVEGDASPEAVIAAVVAAGYGADEKGKKTAKEPAETGAADREVSLLLRRLLTSLVFLLMLMTLSMGPMLGLPLPAFLADSPAIQGLTQLLLTTVILVINQRFFISGTKALLRLSPNMDTLVSLGSAAAMGYSIYSLYVMMAALTAGDAEQAAHCLHELYFESAAMIVTLITLGKMLEARAKGKTTDALKKLAQLAPSTATVLRDGAEQVIPTDQVRVGDCFILRPGQAVPVDGEVIDGEGAVDEAALTGESIPIDKVPGSGVSAGTVNQSGYLRCRALRVGEDTALSQVIRLVEGAAATKAPIAKLADRVSAVFVPSVMAIAVLTCVIWLIAGESVGFALARGISVLVISCPCALGLATPVAIMVGSGVGAREGILFKTAMALEGTGRIHTVALDKTGTVTEGKPHVTDILSLCGTETELLAVAYALEKKSEHPLARAVCEEAEQRGMRAEEVTAFSALPGNGVEGMQNGCRLCGGNLRLMEQNLTVADDVRAQADSLSAAGKTPLFFAREGELLGIVAVADTVKPDSADAIARMREMGLRVVMLTGDNERTARAIGAAVGVDEVRSELLPSDKEEAIRGLSAEGRGVAMVGDGINDAPALTRADIGIAIGAGTDVAIEAADVVLMKSCLTDLPAAILLGRKTLQNIRENLFWAFFYNVIGIPLAAGAWIPLTGWEMNPMFGAAAMSLSSFFVVTNALRLNFVKLYPKTGGKAAAASRENVEKQENVGEKEKKEMETVLKIKGMMCEHCERHVQDALCAIEGVHSAKASHTEGTAVVVHDAGVSAEEMKKAVTAAGYHCA